MFKNNDRYLPGFEPQKNRSSKIKERRSPMKKDPLIEELRRTIEKTGASKTATAKAIGVDRVQIYRWLNNETKPLPGYRKMIEKGIVKLKQKK